MKKLSLGFIAFLQALGLTLYSSLIGLIFWKGARFFGPVVTFLGPTLFLLLFVISAIICALIFGYCPFILWWENKQTKKAINLIIYTTGWLAFFVILVILGVFFFR
ncbi:hypothetical protein MUP46_03320 [Patescibacteria group bacterium]|nr:hypothetical protein [Patescibacteria group bacterium]